MEKVKREDIKQDYDLEETFSEGSYYELIKATHRDHDRGVVIKRLRKNKLPPECVKRLHEEYDQIQKVAGQAIQLDHPNLVNIIEAYDSPDSFSLVMERLTGGDLLDWINSLADKSQATICGIVKTLTDVIDYCHSQGFILYNLKPENVMVSVELGNPVIKVLDFGMSRLVGKNLVLASNELSQFQAPEIIASNPTDEAVDFWSLGALMYLMYSSLLCRLCGRPAFKGPDTELRKKILSGQIDFPEDDWKYISSAAKDLVGHLLDVNPKTRYDTARIRNHPWASANFMRQHPELAFNLYRYCEERKLQKLQQMVKLMLNLTMERVGRPA